MNQVAIIGAGIMGQQIARLVASAGFSIKLFDTDQQRLAQVCSELQGVEPAVDLAELSNADLVIESILEDASIKSRLLSDLESVVRPSAILASNTSTIPISDLSGSLQNRDRVVGLHFFHPVAQRDLVEVVRAETTSQVTIENCGAFCEKIGRQFLIVKDTPGFVVNRLLFPYSGEAFVMAQEGISVEDIDATARQIGMPWGPFELSDEIGLDTVFQAGKNILMRIKSELPLSPILPRMVKKKFLGKKTGVGFYRYDQEGNAEGASAESQTIIDTYKLDEAVGDVSQIADRLLLAVLLEATKLLEDEIVDDPTSIDLALTNGLDFPDQPKGIFGWAESIGWQEIQSRLKRLQALGNRFQPTPWLEKKF